LEGEDRTAAIISSAMDLHDPLPCRALDLFIEAYGAAAGDQALAVLGRGGVYIAGGIAPRIVARLQQGRFLEAFKAKGRFADLMAEIPVRIVMNDRLSLLGATALALQSP
jgi:glucokinase